MNRHPWLPLLLAFGLVFPVRAEVPLTLEGHLVQGGLVIGHTTPGAKVRLDGRRVLTAPDGTFLLGFGRNAKTRARLEIRSPQGERLVKTLQIKARKFRIQRIDGLPPRKVTPRSKKDLAHIRRDLAKVAAARKRADARTDFLGGFTWPVTGPISGVYGSQRILNGKPRRPHMGVDIARPEGTPVRAPADGIVTLAEPDMFFSGGTVFIDHGLGLSTSYLHLSKILVKVGQRVKRGQVIGRIGATGRATGPHLHWGMNLFTTRLDPQLVAGPMPEGTN